MKQKLDLGQTVINLFILVDNLIITNSIIRLYLVYFENIGKPISVRDIAKNFKLSNASIITYNAILELLGLIELKRAAGKSSVPTKVNFLSFERTEKIIVNKSLLAKVKNLKTKMDNYYKKETISTDEIQIIIDNLPEKYRKFSVRPEHIAKLEDLAKETDLKNYTIWFIKNKVERTGFNLGIFLHDSMVEEFRDYYKKHMKNERRKNPNLIWGAAPARLNPTDGSEYLEKMEN